MEISKERYAGEAPISKNPDSALSLVIRDGSVTTSKLQDEAVTTPKIKDKAITPEKLSDTVQGSIVSPFDEKYKTITDSLDEKYTNITNELYDMIASLPVGGIALSGQFGDRTDIGIHQKALTKAIGSILDILGNLTHHNYMDFTLTVVPSTIYKEGTSRVTITCDCSEAISDFDNIKVYVDDVLIAESSDQRVFITHADITDTSVIKAVGTIFGKVITKQQSVLKEIPFFMGGGNVYTDIMNEANRKELIGTLEGDYDATISTSGQYLFIIIPISHKEEFRRCKLDMNGFEIPIEETEMTDYIVCKSLNTYRAGTYNIDIDINS